MAVTFRAYRQPAAPTLAVALWVVVARWPRLSALAQDAAPESPAAIEEVLVTAPEPRYVAPTTRDRIGRIWAPVLINGKGPYRLVLDTGASRPAVMQRVVDELGLPVQANAVRLRGATGSAIVPAVKVAHARGRRTRDRERHGADRRGCLRRRGRRVRRARACRTSAS